MTRRTAKRRKVSQDMANNNNDSQKILSVCTHVKNLKESNRSQKNCEVEECPCLAQWFCPHSNCQNFYCGQKKNGHATSHSTSHVILVNVHNGKVWCTACEGEVSIESNSPRLSTMIKKCLRIPETLEQKPVAHRQPKTLQSQPTRGRPIDPNCFQSRPMLAMSKDIFDDTFPRGLTGLINLGNTCYFNAAIQLLSNCTPFSEFFRYKSTLKPYAINQSGMSNAFAQMIQKIWAEKRQSSVSPNLVLTRIRDEFIQFRGWAQQDAQELIRCLLDLLHRELAQPVYAYEMTLAYEGPSCTSNDDKGGDSGLSSDSESTGSEDTQKTQTSRPIRMRSIVTDVLDGQLESSVKCLTCQTVSNTKETFQDLSLPIPSREQLELIAEFTNSLNPEFDNLSWSLSNWGMWFRSWITWMLPHSVSLTDCLDAFFCPDKLSGDDMYSCEKCNKLRNGVKSCRISKLPEVLTIHLKRFRHDHYSNTKVWTRVDFPLEGLDMSRWTGNSEDCQYELCGVITHEGGGADSGHYIAYCRNDIDGNWYEFDDATVTKLDSAYVLTKEAYVLMYQKTTTDRTERIRETVQTLIQPTVARNLKITDHYFISTEWLEKVGTFVEPGPISNHTFLCKHGHILPRKTDAIGHLIAPISTELYEFLHAEYGGGPPVTALHHCLVCEKQWKYLTNKRAKEWSMYRQLDDAIVNAYHRDPDLVYAGHMPPSLISTSWFQSWKLFIHDPCEDPPGPIDNYAILETLDDGRKKWRRKSSYTRIHREVFIWLQSIYRGGPEVFALDSVQPSEQMIRDWAEKAEKAIMIAKNRYLINSSNNLTSSF